MIPGRADAVTLVSEALRVHGMPFERCYLVDMERTTDTPPPPMAPRGIKIWTQGDRFRVEVTREHVVQHGADLGQRGLRHIGGVDRLQARHGATIARAPVVRLTGRRRPAMLARDVQAKLYGMVHSHPVLTARLMLERCGVEVHAVDIVPGLHPPVVRVAGFRGWTVPAVLIDGRHVQGTLAISRELDRRFPEAGLFPRDGDAREAVQAAERWGHDELQPLARRVFRWAGAHSNAVRAWMAREVVGLPAPQAFGMAFAPAMAFYARRVSGADDATVRADLARLPELLDHADGLLEDGTIGGSPPNAADLQIASSLRLLLAHADLRPRLEAWRSAQATLALLPGFPRPGPGALPPVPAALPVAWLPDRAPATPR
jgi:glutathione S-transferase